MIVVVDRLSVQNLVERKSWDAPEIVLDEDKLRYGATKNGDWRRDIFFFPVNKIFCRMSWIYAASTSENSNKTSWINMTWLWHAI